MAGADYMHCDACGRKAFYDADTDYGDAQIVALCGECVSTPAWLAMRDFRESLIAPSTDSEASE